MTLAAIGLAFTLLSVGATPPPAVVTIVQPNESMSEVRRTLEWLSLAMPDSSPAAVTRRAAFAGVDPFSPKTFAGFGASPKDPLHVWIADHNVSSVYEFRVTDAKQTALAINKAATAPKCWRIADETGVVRGTTLGTARAALTKGKRAFVQLGSREETGKKSALGALAAMFGNKPAKKKIAADYSKAVPLRHGRLYPTAGALGAKPPARPPFVAKAAVKARGAADVWIRTQGGPNFESLVAQSWLSPKGSFTTGQLRSGGKRLALAELVDGAAKTRPLLSATRGAGKARLLSAAQATLRLTKAGIEALGQRVVYREGLSKFLNGEVHAVLTEAGDLVIAAVLRRAPKGAEKKRIEAFVRRANKGNKVAIVGDIVVVARGKISERRLAAAVLRAGKRDRAALDLQVVPPVLLRALDRRSAAGDRFTIPATHLVVLRLMGQPIMNATKAVHLAATPTAGRADFDLDLRY